VKVAAVADYLGDSLAAAGIDRTAGADRTAVQSHPSQRNRKRILRWAGVLQQRGLNLRTAVAVQIANGEPARGPARRKSAAGGPRVYAARATINSWLAPPDGSS
jgi:hypothetical protein